jgi:predicted aldo/keto reductase-like oxidoreductase
VGMKAVGDGLLWRSAQQAFRYAWSLPIHVMVAGMNTLALLEQDLTYAESFVPMSDEEKERWFADAPELGTYVCRQCDKCLPCPAGIDSALVQTPSEAYQSTVEQALAPPGGSCTKASLSCFPYRAGVAG